MQIREIEKLLFANCSNGQAASKAAGRCRQFKNGWYMQKNKLVRHSKIMRVGSVTFCDPFIQNIFQN